jgi:hypothetical protein
VRGLKLLWTSDAQPVDAVAADCARAQATIGAAESQEAVWLVVWLVSVEG